MILTGGDLIVDGLPVKGGRQMRREIRYEAGMVFQQFNLFPQMTALENIAVDDDPRKVIDTPANERMKDFLSHVE